jgi:hypothetical protein
MPIAYMLPNLFTEDVISLQANGQSRSFALRGSTLTPLFLWHHPPILQFTQAQWIIIIE